MMASRMNSSYRYRITAMLAALFFTVCVLTAVADSPSADATVAENATTLPGSGTAIRLEIKGAIGPATSAYIVKGIAYGAETNADVILIEMDTPGGLDSAMRDIIKAILNSDVPVVTYVSPSGSRAASAGTYILYASHIAAMAPATNLGAATPVQIGGQESPSSPLESDPDNDTANTDDEDSAQPEDVTTGSTAMERKSINDAVAYIRGLAELRGRNADWAERAVREAVSLSANSAKEENVIDVVAKTVAELFRLIDGRTVKVRDEERQIASADLTIEFYEPDWRTELLAVITDPNIAYMLMLAGIYGLLFEGYNPGAIVPGVVGAICLLLALFAFQVLPVNYAGLALILLGVMLIIAEAFVPSFGALGLGGVAAFVFGSIILLDTDVPGMSIARSVIVGIALAASSLLLLMVYALMKMRRRPAVSGTESMLGNIAEVLEDFDRHGTVFINGERWNAETVAAVKHGDKVRVTKINGLVLEVTPLEP
jgi:membrane-bound serine protease (ClpP class)